LGSIRLTVASMARLRTPRRRAVARAQHLASGARVAALIDEPGASDRASLRPKSRDRAYMDRVPARDYAVMAPRRRAEVAEAVGEIVHSAASVRLPAAGRSRVRSKRGRHCQILEFAELAARRGMGCAGCRIVSDRVRGGGPPGQLREDDLTSGQGFRNAYDGSKFEASGSCAAQHKLRIQIFARASWSRGGHRMGRRLQRHLLALRAFARGTYSALPARASAPVDVVPVSYVADAIFESLAPEARSARHTTWPPRAREAQSASSQMSRRVLRPEGSSDDSGGDLRPGVHPVPRARRGRRSAEGAAKQRGVLPYFAMRVNFDTWLAQRGSPRGRRRCLD